MILIIKTNKNKLHDEEFVKPVTYLLKDFKVAGHKTIKNGDLENAEKVIITGTSLKDDDYLKDLKKFYWLKDFKKPILGICAGMQIIGKVFGAEIIKDKQIGVFEARIIKKDNLFRYVKQVYSLHNYNNSLPENFEILLESNGTIAAIRKENILCTSFHPEVLNKEVIKKFEQI